MAIVVIEPVQVILGIHILSEKMALTFTAISRKVHKNNLRHGIYTSLFLVSRTSRTVEPVEPIEVLFGWPQFDN